MCSLSFNNSTLVFSIRIWSWRNRSAVTLYGFRNVLPRSIVPRSITIFRFSKNFCFKYPHAIQQITLISCWLINFHQNLLRWEQINLFTLNTNTCKAKLESQKWWNLNFGNDISEISYKICTNDIPSYVYSLTETKIHRRLTECKVCNNIFRYISASFSRIKYYY